MNFENTLINKKINRLKRYTQSDINGLLKQQSEQSSVEEMLYSGKRFRRLVGTTYNSHKFPKRLGINLQTSEGLLASEYIGELYDR